MAKVLVCVAWPYANSPLHLGHVAGSLLPPDVFAKYHTLKGNEVLMVSGSDMHGTPITVRAEKEKTTPEEVAERYHKMNKKAIEDLGINFSLFTKTTTQNHFDVVHDVFTKLMEHGYLYRHGALQFKSVCDNFARMMILWFVGSVCISTPFPPTNCISPLPFAYMSFKHKST